MLRKHALSLVEGPSAFLALPSETPYSQRGPFATSPGAAPLNGLFEHPVSLFKQGMENPEGYSPQKERVFNSLPNSRVWL